MSTVDEPLTVSSLPAMFVHLTLDQMVMPYRPSGDRGDDTLIKGALS